MWDSGEEIIQPLSVDQLHLGVAAFTSSTHQQECILDLILERRHDHHLSGSEHPPADHTGNEFGPPFEEHSVYLRVSKAGVYWHMTLPFGVMTIVRS